MHRKWLTGIGTGVRAGKSCACSQSRPKDFACILFFHRLRTKTCAMHMALLSYSRKQRNEKMRTPEERNYGNEEQRHMP
eukprot:2747153-Amphidinium_carterae.1